MATLAVTALYLLIFVWVSWRYARSRDPLLLDVVWVFATMAMLFVLGIVRLVAGVPPRSATVAVSVLLLAHPMLSLRLVSRLRAVPGWLIRLSAAAWVVMAVPVILVAPPLPPHIVWPLVTAFFLGEVTAAWLFAAEGRRRGGSSRIRLWCAAGGAALFGVVLLFAGRGGSAVVVSRALAIVSALLYLAAFVPPQWLRQTWSMGAAYTVTRRLLAAPVHEPAERTWQRYCDDASAILGVTAVVVLLPAGEGRVRAVGPAGSAFAAREFDATDVEAALARTGTIDALAGWTRPPRIAAELAEATSTRFVTAAPLDFPAGRGALVLLDRYRSLFADDDIALFTELAGRSAALAERAETLAERQRLAVIVECSPDAIVGKTLDGVITSWNAGAEHLYGYQGEEMLGRNAAVLFPPDQQETEARLMRRAAAGERIEQVRVIRRRKDGSPITVALTLSPITGPDGRTTGLASISRDITERERAEAMFEGLLEAGPDAIVGVTEDGTINLLNAQAERLFGYRRSELLGKPVEVLVPERLRNDHPWQPATLFTDPRPRPRSGQRLTALRKDGSEFPAEISLSALETDQGVIVSAAVRDVTGRLVEQAEREQLIAQAERDAAERRLQHTRRLESLGQLAGGVAHDFNNIMAIIANYTELLIDTLDTPGLDAADLIGARNDLAQISRAAERASQLTKQLLAFGRRDIIKTEVLNLNDVIGGVEEMLRRTLGEHIHLITHLDRRLRTVRADAGQIEQILLNFAVNARDAMPGGGTLSVDTADADLDADDTEGTELSPGHYVRLRVSDTGTGMSPEVIERAFEPFFTTKARGSGTGLGLATVYGIATAAGGAVQIYSEADIGTTVTVILPALDAAAVPAATAVSGTTAEKSDDRAPHETILLVEDEAALRQVTTRILTRAGYQVLAADGGAQAIHIAQSHSGAIDLLLTDVIMPKMLGNEVAGRVQEVRAGIPVLYMSGYAQPVLTENGTLPPGVVIVEKPFTGRELLHRVRTVLAAAADDLPGVSRVPTSPDARQRR